MRHGGVLGQRLADAPRPAAAAGARHKVRCPDFAALKLDGAAGRFDGLSKKTPRPAREDAARAEISAAVSEMLGAPGYDAAALAELWCAEPSVRKLKSG